MKNTRLDLLIRISVIICAFLYALSEMFAGNIHWAIGDLILIALWMGGKSVLSEIKFEIEAQRFFKKFIKEAKRKEAA